MKDATYNTGRTITIELDRLGNADIWTIYQILTDGTGDVFAGHEEDASPAADPDAATEIFLHIAETADARAEGADGYQAAWLQGMKNEYKDIFGEEPTPEEEPAPAEIEEEVLGPINARQIIEAMGPEAILQDDMIIWLDYSPRGYDAWQIVEEAARTQSTLDYAEAKYGEFFDTTALENRVLGMAMALTAASGLGAPGDWVHQIKAYAEGNYEDGRKIR